MLLDHGTVELPAHAVFKLNSTDQINYLKIKEGTKRQYIDAYIHVKSQKGYAAMKRAILVPFLKDNRMFLDEYTLESTEDVQVGWLF